jgi:hypothetical protein
MAEKDIPNDWIEDKPDIPPPRVKDKFENWEETYSVTRLEELSVSDIESAKLEFQAEVEVLKTEYRPGQLINSALAQVVGKEPFTQEEFGEVRRHISDKADEIRMNFKQAKGRRRRENKQQRASFITNLTSRIADSLTNINISLELPKLK